MAWWIQLKFCVAVYYHKWVQVCFRYQIWILIWLTGRHLGFRNFKYLLVQNLKGQTPDKWWVKWSSWKVSNQGCSRCPNWKSSMAASGHIGIICWEHLVSRNHRTNEGENSHASFKRTESAFQYGYHIEEHSYGLYIYGHFGSNCNQFWHM